MNLIRAFVCCGLMIATGCGRNAVEPVDLAEPTTVESEANENVADSSPDFVDTSEYNAESPFLADSALLDSSGVLDSSITQMFDSGPANSSVKTIAANFETVEYHNGNCEMIFIAGENQIRFCGAFGEFVDVGQHAANKQLIGKQFIIIYKTENSKPDGQSDLYSSDCKTMVFAKPAQ